MRWFAIEWSLHLSIEHKTYILAKNAYCRFFCFKNTTKQHRESWQRSRGQTCRSESDAVPCLEATLTFVACYAAEEISLDVSIKPFFKAPKL